MSATITHQTPLGMASPPERWVTADDLCQHFSLGRRTVERETAAGMPHRKLGRATRYQISAVDLWFEAKYASTTSNKKAAA